MKTIIYILVSILLIFFIFSYCDRGKISKEDIIKERIADSSYVHLPEDVKKLIGLEFHSDSIPDGFVEQTGYVVGIGEEEEYIINHVTRAKLQLIWFCLLIDRDIDGMPILKIIDIIRLPEIQKGEELLMGTCHYEDEVDPEIIAIVKYSDSGIQATVQKAWRANRITKKLEKISTEFVNCFNESYYL
jgi:hypothetical protein